MTLVPSQGTSETCADQISQHSTCVITNLITLYLLKVKEPMAISHTPLRSIQHPQHYVKVKWLCMLHKLYISVEVAGWNADLYG